MLKRLLCVCLVGSALAGCTETTRESASSVEPAIDDDAQSLHGHARAHGHANQGGNLGKPHLTRDPIALAVREQRVRQVYENLVYPRPIPILTGETSVENIFERTAVRGRVTPVGQFLDFSAVVEYFYALALTPASRVENVTFRSLFAGDDKVAVAVDIFFCRAPYENCDPNVPNSESSQTLTQVGFFTFNKKNRIISMDLNILNLGAASDLPNDPALHATTIQQLCTALTVAHIEPTTGTVVNRGTCTSSFDAVDDFAPDFPVTQDPFQNCVDFMHSIPFGSWNRANSNTVTCRQLHTLLTAIDPDKHCPHTSPDGGGACIEFPYGSYYDATF